MSERIYAWLLRLYPAEFRKNYGDEAMQLFRARAHDERGFRRLRFWMDIARDLAGSVPGEHGRVPLLQPETIPAFRSVDDPPPSAGSLLLGGLLTMFAIGAAGSLNDIRGHFPTQGWFADAKSSSPGVDRATTRGTSTKPEKSASTNQRAGVPTLDASDRQRVVLEAAGSLRNNYFDPQVAAKTADQIVARENSGAYETRDGAEFAFSLTKDLQQASGDKHLEIIFRESALPPQPLTTIPPEARARYAKAMKDRNCLIEKVEMRRRKIGYLKLNGFPDADICVAEAQQAMTKVNDAKVLIIDLRDNGGGYASMVTFISSYLFDHPEYLFSPRDKVTEKSWTRSPVPGSRLADKPVYILTSHRTISAAEQFTYNMKMLRRATIVGEVTRGATHGAVFHRLEDHFGMAIPEVKPINPYSDKDWEGTGILPDVPSRPELALEIAEKLAVTRIARR
jgi:hypothetical protein